MAFDWFKKFVGSFGSGREDTSAVRNYSAHAQQVLALARKEADRFHHNFMGTEHLLLGLISLERGFAVEVLRKMGLDLENVRREVEKQVGSGPDQKIIAAIPYMPRVRKVLSLAGREAKALKHTCVDAEHILLGLLQEGDGVAARVLMNLGVDRERTRDAVLNELAGYPPRADVTSPAPRSAFTVEIQNNFTPRAQQVLSLARKEAERFNHNFVGTEHVLLGLIRLGQGVAVNVLQKMGLDLETVRLEVEKQVGMGPDRKESGNIPYTPRTKKVLSLAGKEAKALNHTYVGTEHILLGILREGDGVAARVLLSLDVSIEETRQEILQELDPNFQSSLEDSVEAPKDHVRLRHLASLPFSDHFQKALVQAGAVCRDFGRREITPEHLVLAMLQRGKNAATTALKSLGVMADDFRAELSSRSPKGQEKAAELEFSDHFTELCNQARLGAGARDRDIICTDDFLLATLLLQAGPICETFDKLPVNREKLRAVILSLPPEP